MGIKAWTRIAYGTLITSLIMTVFCITPGPGIWLANQKVYITFISHIALVFGALGVIAGMRAEREAQTNGGGQK